MKPCRGCQQIASQEYHIVTQDEMGKAHHFIAFYCDSCVAAARQNPVVVACRPMAGAQ